MWFYLEQQNQRWILAGRVFFNRGCDDSSLDVFLTSLHSSFLSFSYVYLFNECIVILTAINICIKRVLAGESLLNGSLYSQAQIICNPNSLNELKSHLGEKWHRRHHFSKLTWLIFQKLGHNSIHWWCTAESWNTAFTRSIWHQKYLVYLRILVLFYFKRHCVFLIFY